MADLDDLDIIFEQIFYIIWWICFYRNTTNIFWWIIKIYASSTLKFKYRYISRKYCAHACHTKLIIFVCHCDALSSIDNLFVPKLHFIIFLTVICDNFTSVFFTLTKAQDIDFFMYICIEHVEYNLVEYKFF